MRRRRLTWPWAVWSLEMTLGADTGNAEDLRLVSPRFPWQRLKCSYINVRVGSETGSMELSRKIWQGGGRT